MPRADWRLVVAVSTLAFACGRSDPPRLKMSPLSASANDVRYQLRNVGGRTLMLDGLAPACGCVPTSRLPETLAAGASTVVDLQCRPTRTVGEAVRELRVLSSDPSNPETIVRVTLPGQGPGPDPAALYFGYVPVGESAVRDVVLPVPVAVETLTPPAQAELAVEPMPARADAAFGVRVRFTPRVPSVVRATIDLGPAGGPLAVVAVGYAGILALPAEVTLPRATGAAGLPVITLVGVAEPLAITHVDYPPGLSGELRTVIPGRQFRLVLRGRGHAGAGAIRLRSDAGAPLLTIPVVGSEAGAPAAPRA